MNEKWLVVGFRPVNFKDKQSDKTVNGFTLFLSRSPNLDKASEDEVCGQITDKLFISSQYVQYAPELGDEIVLLYNKYGKVGAIQVV